MEPYFSTDKNYPASSGNRKAKIMLVAILNFLQSWRRYNASLNELNQLGDRELADIGITRSDIPRGEWDSANRSPHSPPKTLMKAPALCRRFRVSANRSRAWSGPRRLGAPPALPPRLSSRPGRASARCRRKG